MRLPGFVRFMLSAKTEAESFAGLIRVLNGAYSLLCSKSDKLQTCYRASLHLEGDDVPSLHSAAAHLTHP